MRQYFPKQTVRDRDLRGRTVLVRTDFNVPLTADGQISDDLRIRASLPTLRYVLASNCRLVLMSHLGRPQGRQAAYSLRPVADRLAELLGRPVQFVDTAVGEPVKRALQQAAPGSVTLLENLRFYPEEKADDTAFAQALAVGSQADLFVQDGFAVVHRADASTHAITRYLPSVAGLLVESEYQMLHRAVDQPRRPLVALVGGAKVSDKLPLLQRLVEVADQLLIGGAMANTFLAARGVAMGQSLVEPGQERAVQQIEAAVRRKLGVVHRDRMIWLPCDVAVATDGPELSTQRRDVMVERVAAEERALDIGQQTIAQFRQLIAQAGTVLWNGPLGYTEQAPFAEGSRAVAQAIVANQRAVSVVGGGDTADFLWRHDLTTGFSHISTGGGASMALMAGRALPGVESLLDAPAVK